MFTVVMVVLTSVDVLTDGVIVSVKEVVGISDDVK